MKKRGKKHKKGQVMGMPFIFIFSLILIAVALFVGIWAIKGILDRACQAEINSYVAELENEIISVWSAEEASKTTDNLKICNRIETVCFVNQDNCNLRGGIIPADLCSVIVPTWARTDKDNLFLYPGGKAENLGTYSAWHLKCGTQECLSIDKTRCFPVEDGKVIFRITKEGGSPYVTISQASQA
ncbi:MAG: hypothetical protein IB618_03875 [Candidatus Pacearchaeota archaeon]|nr:MAG: hypothetical protein IB618_03875 [Candidatus Pacearchaeota archaeon]